MSGTLGSGPLLRQALDLHGQGQWAQAARLCQQVLAHHPQQADALHMLALAHAQLGDRAEAHIWFGKAQEAAPERGDIRANHARMWLEAGQAQNAMAVCAQIPQTSLQPELVHIIWGDAMIQSGLVDDAITLLTAVVNNRPGSKVARMALGNALHRAALHAAAEAQYDAALHIDPKMVDALHNKAMSLISLKRYTEAEKTLHTVLTLSPALASAQRHLANVGSHWLRPVQSKRYRLEPWGPAHVSYLRACFGHRAFIRLYNRHLSLLGSDKDLAEKIKASAGAHPLDTKAVNWVIVDRATSEPLGLAALVEIDFAHRRAEFLLGMPEPEKAAWGAGLEVALLVMHFAFRTASLNKLVSIVYAHNRAAQDNTMELGFSQEGYLRAELWNADTGSYQDIYRNGMTQDQFLGQARLKKLTRRLLGMN